jgi:metal-responsive CopG/Arc/MetJ family transcriptional regulator
MKTAVSIPDPLTRAADRIARRLGISRSELYTRALEQLIDRESDDETTRRLDEVYSTEDPRLEPDIVRAQRRAGGDAS